MLARLYDNTVSERRDGMEKDFTLTMALADYANFGKRSTDAGFVAAADANDLSRMVATAAQIDDGPSAFRYPRGDAEGGLGADAHAPLEIGKGRIVREGTAIALLSFGARLGEAKRAADKLATMGLSTTVADARFAKPLDEDLVRRLAREHEVLITIEEGSIGGFGSFVLQALSRPAQCVVEMVEQPIGIVGDSEEPLSEYSRRDGGAARRRHGPDPPAPLLRAARHGRRRASEFCRRVQCRGAAGRPGVLIRAARVSKRPGLQSEPRL